MKDYMTTEERDALVPELRKALSNVGSVRPWTSGRFNDPGIEIIITSADAARALLRGLKLLADTARPSEVSP